MTYDIVIIGGGAAGIATASSILKRNAKVTIAVVDPAPDHYYQPGWTMVGAGVFTPEQTPKADSDIMPQGVKWVRVRSEERRVGKAWVRTLVSRCAPSYSK